MHQTQHSVAVLDAVHDDPHRHQVKDLIQRLMLKFHFLVYAVKVFGTTVNVVVDIDVLQGIVDPFHHVVDGVFPLILALAHLLRQVVIGLWLQEFQRDILQLHLDGVHTQTSSQRRVDVQRLPALFDDLVVGHVVDGPQIVKPVGKLDDQDPDVLGHCQKHLPQVLRLPFLFALKFQGGQLGDAVYQHGHVFPEIYDQFFFRVGSIFDDVMKKSRHDGFFVHSQISQDLRHRHGVDQIRFPRFSQLTAVHFLRHIVGVSDQVDIVIGIIF